MTTKSMYDYRFLLGLGLLATLVFVFATRISAEEAGPLFVKVYAGPALNTAREFHKAVQHNLKKKVDIPDETLVACEPGNRYGLGVIVSAPGKQTFSFETTAIWRDSDPDKPPRRSSREHTLRKNQYGTRRFFFTIRENGVDHDMTFIAHVGKQVFLRHKFLIRGCPDAGRTSE